MAVVPLDQGTQMVSSTSAKGRMRSDQGRKEGVRDGDFG